MLNFSQNVVTWIASLLEKLPQDPFRQYLVSDSSFSDWMGTLNYFVPVGTIITITEAWLVCVAAYYLISIALRWVKAI